MNSRPPRPHPMNNNVKERQNNMDSMLMVDGHSSTGSCMFNSVSMEKRIGCTSKATSMKSILCVIPYLAQAHTSHLPPCPHLVQIPDVPHHELKHVFFQIAGGHKFEIQFERLHTDFAVGILHRKVLKAVPKQCKCISINLYVL